MPSLLTVSSVLMCPHGGQVTAISSNARVQASGGFVLRVSDTFIVVGCPLNVLGAPHPCVQVQWMPSGTRTQVAGDFVLNEASTGLCLAADMAPQGTALILATQPEVSAT